MTTAFLQGPVFVGDGRILDDGTVLVEGERIVKVAEGNVPIPKGAHKIPMAGRILLPGLIDCHVHLCLDGSADPVTLLMGEPLPLTTLKAARFAALMRSLRPVAEAVGRKL